MKYTKDEKIIWEKDEPYLRSCWECNPFHKHLKKVNMAYRCFVCGKVWIYGKFMKNDSEALKVLKASGLKPNTSSKTIDKGYRIMAITLRRKHDNKKRRLFQT